MLAATLFMALTSHHMQHRIKEKCISDNKELIRRLTEHKQYDGPYPNPNATLASEYDIIEKRYTKHARFITSHPHIIGYVDTKI
jgi:hypothetical protein